MDQVKLITTLGPSTKSEKSIRSLTAKGVDYFRVNMSHSNIGDLEYFINSNKIDDDAASYDCQNWLEENKLSSRHSNYEIQNLLEIHKVQVDPLETYTIRWANHDSNNFNYYPGDLLCLTQRTAKYYPEWNHRRFLIEAKKQVIYF